MGGRCWRMVVVGLAGSESPDGEAGAAQRNRIEAGLDVDEAAAGDDLVGDLRWCQLLVLVVCDRSDHGVGARQIAPFAERRAVLLERLDRARLRIVDRDLDAV